MSDLPSPDLPAAQAQITALQNELNAIRGSPAWRLISSYRRWIAAGRGKPHVRVIDKIAQAAITRFTSSHQQASLSMERSGARLTGNLIACPDPPYNGKVFYLENAARHWVPSTEHLDCYGLSITDAVQATPQQVRSFRPAGPIPGIWPEAAWRNPPRTNSSVLREIATSRLHGSGIEFGAGTHPVSVPLSCEVKFADFVPEQDLRRRAYEAQGTDFVPLTYVTGLEEMSGIPDESLDFVIASHVIEHLRNPLQAFKQVFNKLKVGGSLVLFVPEKTKTFDKDREITPLDHLILDYKDPNPERDIAHYREFFAKAFVTPEDAIDQRVRDAIADNYDIHFHTWTYDSFHKMVKYAQKHVAPLKEIWSQPAIEGVADSIEFYFVLQK